MEIGAEHDTSGPWWRSRENYKADLRREPLRSLVRSKQPLALVFRMAAFNKVISFMLNSKRFSFARD